MLFQYQGRPLRRKWPFFPLKSPRARTCTNLGCFSGEGELHSLKIHKEDHHWTRRGEDFFFSWEHCPLDIEFDGWTWLGGNRKLRKLSLSDLETALKSLKTVIYRPNKMMFLFVFHFSLAVLLSSSETWLMRLEFRLEFLETSHIDSSGFIYSWNKLTNDCIKTLFKFTVLEKVTYFYLQGQFCSKVQIWDFPNAWTEWKLKIMQDCYGLIFGINIYILEKQVFKEQRLELCTAFWSFPGATRSGPKCPAID